MRGLRSDSYPPAHKKLTGSTNEFRIRVGNYRILYTDRLVTIHDFDRRDKVYR